MNNELSIFIDESGDFGKVTKHSVYYIVSLVFHEQNRKLDKPIEHLRSSLLNLGLEPENAIHCMPLIRNEDSANNVELFSRQKTFRYLFQFLRHSGVRYKSIVIDKKEHNVSLQDSISHESDCIIKANKQYLESFDSIKVYYDRGQKQLTKVLSDCFINGLNNIEFKFAKPKEYYLFQVADLICSLELLNVKKEDLNKSEIMFFRSRRYLYKNYLKPLFKLRLN